MEFATEKDRLIVALSKRGRATGEDLLLRFMDKYGLMNLAQASVEQLREFYEERTGSDTKMNLHLNLLITT